MSNLPVITSPPFGQDKACCKLIESPEIHSVGKRFRGILHLIRIASQKLFSPEKPFLFIFIIVNQLQLNLTLFYMMFYLLLLAVLHRSAFPFGL